RRATLCFAFVQWRILALARRTARRGIRRRWHDGCHCPSSGAAPKPNGPFSSLSLILMSLSKSLVGRLSLKEFRIRFSGVRVVWHVLRATLTTRELTLVNPG